MADLHISLISVALAGLITLWLGYRCGNARGKAKVLHGDGGDVALSRHMRAQANFVEYTPFALALIIMLDLADQDGWVLGISALLYFIGRVLHPLGMQADTAAKTRVIGISLTMLLLLFWSVWALLVAFRVL